MAHTNHTPGRAETEEALIVLFCLVDDAYTSLNSRALRYESLKRLSDSEVITLAPTPSWSTGCWDAPRSHQGVMGEHESSTTASLLTLLDEQEKP
jgi:hypothetical protein